MTPKRSTLWRAAAAALMLCPMGSAAQVLADDMENAVEVSLLPGWREADGTHMAALRIVLAPGWKTYWRAPGDGGVPTRVDFSGSENLAAATVLWPTPQVFRQNGMRSIGYRDEVIVPISMIAATDGEDITLYADMDFGICDEICLPVNVMLEHNFAASEQANVEIISAAVADRPVPAAQTNLRAVECEVTYGQGNAQFEVTLDLPPLDGLGEALVIEPSDPAIWVSEPTLTRTGDILVASAIMANPTGEAFVLDLSKTRLTLLTTQMGVDIPGC